MFKIFLQISLLNNLISYIVNFIFRHNNFYHNYSFIKYSKSTRNSSVFNIRKVIVIQFCYLMILNNDNISL